MGVQAISVTIEVHLTNGLPKLLIVGLPEAAVKESQERVRSALLNTQFEFPLQRITINLAPADLPKEGGRFDLPIALGILAASRQIPSDTLSEYEFVGELALNGDLRPVRGVLPMALAARNASRQAVVPFENAKEAGIVSGVSILPVKHLLDICSHLQKITPITLYDNDQTPHSNYASHIADLSDVRGQHHAKRALEIAAAGGHNLLMMGPPGTGKTMLASRMPGILPPMTEQEALETATVLSIARNGFNADVWGIRPFRSPHHTASGVALVGGGSHPRPGEVSLAHNGILFLDELPEFDKRVLEVLREPIESGHITISRAANTAEFPANFQLVAAMNPCPCGYLGDATNNRCQCSAQQVTRYRSRISGPLLDRIDLHIEVPNQPRIELRKDTAREDSKTVRTRVIAAREIQLQRCQKPNNLLGNQDIDKHCRLSDTDERLLDTAIERLGLSARAWYRILKVSRTIADLAKSESIQTAHLMESITYRQLERKK